MTHLDNYKIEEDVYLIGGYLDPISIKDQLSRVILISKEMECSNIGKDVAIVGNGLVARLLAFYLIDAGRQVTIYGQLDEKSFLFNRELDLFQYDWPSECWNRNDDFLPRTDDQPSISIKTIDAILRLSPNFKRSIACFVDIEQIEFETKTISNTPKCSQANTNKVNTINNSTSSTFNTIFLCIGFGRESCHLPPKHKNHQSPTQDKSYGFWGENNKKYKEESIKDILISGGGDGALQDFILSNTVFNHVKDAYIGWDLERRLSTEMDALRHMFDIHANLRLNGCAAVETLDVRLRKIIDELFDRSCDLDLVIKGSLNHNKRIYLNLRPPRGVTVNTAYGNIKYNLGLCYPLNRLIAYMLLTYFERNEDPRVSYGEIKYINRVNEKDKPFDIQNMPPNMPTEFDLILIRHGLDKGGVKDFDPRCKTMIKQQFTPKLSDLAELFP